MIRKIHFGLHEMREVPAKDKDLAGILSHWSNRLPKQVIVTRSGIQTDNAIMNTRQADAVIFHEYQGKELWREIIMEEERFRRVYQFVTKHVTTLVEKREAAYIGSKVVKKKRSGRKNAIYNH